MTTVAITGASSSIGRALAAVLTARGDGVVAFQRGEFDPDRVVGVSLVEQRRGDVRDAAALEAALAECDVVVHLAAKVGVVGDRDEYLSINVDGTRNVLAAAARPEPNFIDPTDLDAVDEGYLETDASPRAGLISIRISRKPSRDVSSIDAVGSSRKRISGSEARARAISTRCTCPPGAA